MRIHNGDAGCSSPSLPQVDDTFPTVLGKYNGRIPELFRYRAKSSSSRMVGKDGRSSAARITAPEIGRIRK